jgi:hypothetical protein
MQSPTVLIAVVNRLQDLSNILRKKWYRIPVKRMPSKPFEYIAFYQTTALGKLGGRIEHYARISKRKTVKRKQLLPHEPDHPRADEDYCKLTFRTVRKLKRPIVNRPGMRINFGFATLNRLNRSRTIANLFGIRQVEVVFRKLLVKCRVPFTPEHVIKHADKMRYRLDFAIFCRKGKLDVECDMRKFHSGARRLKDARRDRFMKRQGWKVMRFTDERILNDPNGCMTELRSAVERLGGL